MHDEAAEAARQHRLLQPLTLDAYVNLANAYYSSGRKQDAIRAVHQALTFSSLAQVKAKMFAWYREVDPQGCSISQ
ncbi:MAG: hypothetical protein ACRD44_04050, partial [Bryobacteraceae bacterium]